MVIIDGKEYQGSGSVADNHLAVIILASIEDAFSWNKELIVEFDGATYTVVGLRSIGKFDEQIRVEWDCETEATRLERELEQKEAELEEAESELVESNSRISSIRDAIVALGTGVPTLTKLLTFLSAVKEAIHYDGIDSDA